MNILVFFVDHIVLNNNYIEIQLIRFTRELSQNNINKSAQQSLSVKIYTIFSKNYQLFLTKCFATDKKISQRNVRIMYESVTSVTYAVFPNFLIKIFQYIIRYKKAQIIKHIDR